MAHNWQELGIPEPPLSAESLDPWKNVPLPASKAPIAQKPCLTAEEELAWTQAQIQLSESHRQVPLESPNIYHAALAPHRYLPERVLRNIFIWSVHVDNQESKLEADLNSVVDPDWDALPDMRLIVCQVCSRWRSIALETPELWSDVRASFKERLYPRLVNVLLIWVVRSGQHPLSWDLRGYHDDSRIMDLLTQVSHRLRFLSIDCLVASPVAALPPRSIDLLETLCLGNKWNRYGFKFEFMKGLFAEAPRLRSVTSRMQGVHLRDWRLPWHQIHELNLLLPSPASQYYPILNQCPALTRARIEITHIQAADLDGPDVSLPKLCTLYLASPSLRDTEQFLQRISVPGLSDLTLQFNDIDHRFNHALSFPALQRVHVPGPLRKSGNRLPWLRAWHSAVEVYLPNTDLYPVFDQIADGSLLPNATLLALYKTEPSAIIAMLEARLTSRTCSTITHVALTNSLLDVTVEQMDSFRKLLKNGVFLAHGPWARPDAASIEARARSDFETGQGLFEGAEPVRAAEAELEY
ncbi:hypothetical protein B0H11DRAFT_2429610 [Mycena galericulata]|nr:hypothetical protein B0H11DRAFT_2429610 [Mycena galericulata]